MKRTISIKLLPEPWQDKALQAMRQAFADACNCIAPLARANKCHNRVKLHHLGYRLLREAHPCLGSQMVCNAIRKTASAYKTLLANNKKFRNAEWPETTFRHNTSIHYDKRTYGLRDNSISLFTLEGRIIVPVKMGDFQKRYLTAGVPMEAELVSKGGKWFFNLVLDLPDATPRAGNAVLGVDMGENNLAATSTGKLFGGGQLCHERDKYLHLRGRLQRKGSKSAKQLLRKVSGRESRHVRHVNHEVSRAIVAEAIANNCSVIAMENLTNIRKRVKAGKRVRSRLHRWAWRQLQDFVAYKAEEQGIQVIFVNPAYTSRRCAICGNIGHRQRHRFSCPSCGRLAHADLNAGQNIASLGATAVASTGAVNRPHVGQTKSLAL